MRKLALLALLPLLAGSIALADIGIPIPDFSVTSGTPYVHNELVTGDQTIYGLNFVGDWTAGPGNPYSSEMECLITPPVGAPYDWDPMGGVSSGDPYHFGDTSTKTLSVQIELVVFGLIKCN